MASGARMPIRVTYFLHSGEVGGASVSLLFLLQQLDRSKYSPEVVLPEESAMCDTFRRNSIPIRIVHGMTYFSHTTGERVHAGNPRSILQLAGYLPSIWRMYCFVRSEAPDIVHLNSSTLSAQVIGAKLAGARVVWHIREHVIRGHLGLRRLWHKLVGRFFADALIFILKTEAEALGSRHKTHVVYNFVDFSRFDRHRRDGRLSAGRSDTRKVVMLGGVSRIKGTLEFVQACALVRRRIPSVQFAVVGDAGLGGSGGRVRRLSGLIRKALGRRSYPDLVHEYAREHCGEAVQFTGIVQDVPALLEAADLLVFPSTAPHFPRPVIEAAAMGVPVVASDIEGPNEIITNGENGVLVPPGNPEALADAVIHLLVDPALARAMADNGWQRARELYDAGRNSRAVCGIYESLMNTTDMTTKIPAKNQPGVAARSPAAEPETPLHPLNAVWFAVWLSVVSGAYYFNILTGQGRLAKLQRLIDKLW